MGSTPNSSDGRAWDRRLTLGLVAVFLVSRLLVVAVALAVESSYPMPASMAEPYGVTATTAPVLRSLTSSDAVWYIGIAEHGYHAAAVKGPYHDYAFFPLYPALVRATSAISGGDAVVASLLVSNVAFALALAVFAKLSLPLLGSRGTVVAGALLALAPGAVAFAMGYADSLLLVLTLAAVLAAERRRLAVMSGLFALAALTRLPGIVLGVPLVLVVASQLGWRLDRRWLWLLSGPIALAAWFGYLYWLTGDQLAYLHAQAAWDHPATFPAGPTIGPVVPPILTIGLLIASLLVYVPQLVNLRRSGIPRAHAAYLLVTSGLVVATGRIVSAPRWIAVVWPATWLFVARRSRALQIAALTWFLGAFVVSAYLYFSFVVAP